MSDISAGVGSGGALRLVVTLVSQNQGGNYSTVNVKAYMVNNSSVRSFNNNSIGMNIYGSAAASTARGFDVGAHSQLLVMDNNFDIGHDAAGNGSSSFGFHLNATGTSTFGGGGDVAPANDSWPRIPKPPNPPTVGIAWLESQRAGIYTTVAGDENGATTDAVNYRVHRVSDGAWMGDMQGGFSGVAFAGLARNTAYNAYGQSHNVAGWGGFGGPTGFTTRCENPSSPPTGVDTIGPTSARILVSAPADNGGIAIDTYQTYVMTNNAWPDAGGNVVASAGGGTFTATGLLPSKQYFYTSRARNAAGLWSAWTPMKSFTTLPSANINVAGVWKNAIPYVNDATGTPKLALPWKNVAGVWKQ